MQDQVSNNVNEDSDTVHSSSSVRYYSKQKQFGFFEFSIIITLMPAPTRKSTNTDLIFVCPVLKSSPPIKVFCEIAYSMTPVHGEKLEHTYDLKT